MSILIRTILQGIIISFLAFLSFIGLTPQQAEPELDKTFEQETIIDLALNEDTDLDLLIENEISKIKEFTTASDISITESEIEETEIVQSFSVKDVTVTVLCLGVKGNSIEISTGSGVIISPNGLVLTNAHVAQSLLLKDSDKIKNQNCTIRQDGVLTSGYEAVMVFISPEWVEKNWELYKTENGRGTGEKDYALLAITKSTTGNAPGAFPYVTIDTRQESVEVGDEVVAVGYPGIKTSIFDINGFSQLKIANTKIDEVFTFQRNTIDIFSTEENVVAQKGSSGGGIFEHNKLIGLIVTTNPANNSDLNSINALSLYYINTDLKQQLGYGLRDLMAKDLIAESNNFLNLHGERLKGLLEQAI